ncbi:hypothetical protein MBLNU230_g2594t1 [Neophaeotheca triangularis]
MHPLFWKTLTAFLALLILVQQVSELDGYHLAPTCPYGPPTGHLARTRYQDSSGNPLQWSYEWERDRNDQTLTKEQCDVAFPALYHSIDRSVDYWRKRNLTSGSIRIADKNEAGITILLHDQKLRIAETKGLARPDFRERMVAVLHQLYRTVLTATAIGEPLPDMEFSITVDDIPHLPDGGDYAVWAFTRDMTDPDDEAVWLIPDFNFLAAPRAKKTFQEMQALARMNDGPLSNKLPQVVWRGVRWTNERIRGAMISAVEGKEWADVRDIDWSDQTQVMRMEDYCRYNFVLNTEGHSWSSRMLYILNCDSLPIIHELSWDAHFYHLLEANVNYIPVANNFSNLEEQVLYYTAHKEEAQEIADNARALFRERYLTPAATACYWRRLLRSWRDVAFEPEVWEVWDGKGENVSSVRGTPFEHFMYGFFVEPPCDESWLMDAVSMIAATYPGRRRL